MPLLEMLVGCEVQGSCGKEFPLSAYANGPSEAGWTKVFLPIDGKQLAQLHCFSCCKARMFLLLQEVDCKIDCTVTSRKRACVNPGRCMAVWEAVLANSVHCLPASVCRLPVHL